MKPHEMQTYTGIAFDLLNPTPDMVTSEDICHHLSLENRYCGASDRTWSVAQHTILCHMILQHMLRTRWASLANLAGGPAWKTSRLFLEVTLHDAHEAYTKDLHRPYKQAIAILCDGTANPVSIIEDRVKRAIRARFGLGEPRFPQTVRLVDEWALRIERERIVGNKDHVWPVDTLTELPTDCILDSAFPDDIPPERAEQILSRLIAGKRVDPCKDWSRDPT